MDASANVNAAVKLHNSCHTWDMSLKHFCSCHLASSMSRQHKRGSRVSIIENALAIYFEYTVITEKTERQKRIIS